MDLWGVGINNLAALALTLCVTNMIQGIIGFGGIVLALPVLAFFFPLPTLIPALVVVNLLQCLYIALRGRDHLKWRELGSMLALSIIGLPIGWLVFSSLSADHLKIVLGGTVVVIAAWNLARAGKDPVLPTRAYHLFNFAGGLAQGALASGGPFMVIYAARALPDKTSFRATLSLVWVVHNFLLCGMNTARGNWSAVTLPVIAVALPCIVLATWLGALLHDRIPQAPFRTIVFIVLLVSGLVLLRPLLAFL